MAAEYLHKRKQKLEYLCLDTPASLSLSLSFLFFFLFCYAIILKRGRKHTKKKINLGCLKKKKTPSHLLFLVLSLFPLIDPTSMFRRAGLTPPQTALLFFLFCVLLLPRKYHRNQVFCKHVLYAHMYLFHGSAYSLT